MPRLLLYILGAMLLIMAVLYAAWLIHLKFRDDPEATAYDEKGPLVNGFAIATRQYKNLLGLNRNRYGFMNAQGKLITFVSYQYAENFDDNGLAFVGNLAGRYGFIDTTGQVAIPLVYAGATAFIDGVCLVTKYVGEGEDSVAVGFIDRQQREVSPFLYSGYRTYPNSFSGQPKPWYYAVSTGGLMDGRKWGYVDTRGKLVIPVQYDDTEGFDGDYAVVGKKASDDSGLMLFGLIDKLGRQIIPLAYNELSMDRKTQLLTVGQYHRNSTDEVWGLKKGKINLRNEIVEPLTDDETD